MATTLKIKVTKDILNETKNCAADIGSGLGDRCAIAVAVRDIFPFAYVCIDEIKPMGIGFNGVISNIPLPPCAQHFISEFDTNSPTERALMPELEFEISIPDKVIEKINIDEIRPLLENHPTLELIEK